MAKWTVDTMHTDVQFKVKHLMINTVTGEFTSYRVDVDAPGDDFSNATFSFEADVASITTKNEMRDNHLKSDDFFNAEKFPVMTFSGKGLTKISENEFELHGDLTIRDITKPVTLNAEYGGQMVDFYGNVKAGFEISGSLNRKDFGLSWNGVTEAGGIVVSDTVKLILNVQLQKLATETVAA